MRVIEQPFADGAGNDWLFTLGLPSAGFEPWVIQYWEIRGVIDHRREKVFPLGDVVVMVNLGPTQYWVDRDDENHVVEYRDAWISGLHSGHLITDSPHGSWLSGVRLTPEGAYRLLGENPAGLADRVVDLDTVFGPSAEGLVDRLRSAPDARARFRIMEGLIRARLVEAPEWEREVRWAVGALQASQGGAPIAFLAEEVGWSRQRLHERFVNSVGLAPKLFARVLRFGQAVRAIGDLARPDMAAIAAEAGYHDQSHFIRDFREFTGFTPGDYLRRRVEGSDLGFAKDD